MVLSLLLNSKKLLKPKRLGTLLKGVEVNDVVFSKTYDNWVFTQPDEGFAFYFDELKKPSEIIKALDSGKKVYLTKVRGSFYINHHGTGVIHNGSYKVFIKE